MQNGNIFTIVLVLSLVLIGQVNAGGYNPTPTWELQMGAVVSDTLMSHIYPLDLAIDSSGNLYILNDLDHSVNNGLGIVKFDSTGNFSTYWRTRGQTLGEFNEPISIVFDSINENIYVVDKVNKKSTYSYQSGYSTEEDKYAIIKMSSDGSYITHWPSNYTKKINDLVVNKSGFIISAESNAIRVYTPKGQLVQQTNLTYKNNRKLGIDNSDNIYVTGEYSVSKYTAAGKFITSQCVANTCKIGKDNGLFIEPSGIAVDKSDNVYITDAERGDIQKFTSDLKYISTWGSKGTGLGQFTTPSNIVVDPTGNSFYVMDDARYGVQKGIISSSSMSTISIPTTKITSVSPTQTTVSPTINATETSIIPSLTMTESKNITIIPTTKAPIGIEIIISAFCIGIFTMRRKC